MMTPVIVEKYSKGRYFSITCTKSQKVSNSEKPSVKNLPAIKFIPWQYPTFGFLYEYATKIFFKTEKLFGFLKKFSSGKVR